MWAAHVFAGRPTPVDPEAFRLVAALDLSMTLPALVCGGVLLWRRRRRGVVLAAIAGVQGLRRAFLHRDFLWMSGAVARALFVILLIGSSVVILQTRRCWSGRSRTLGKQSGDAHRGIQNYRFAQPIRRRLDFPHEPLTAEFGTDAVAPNAPTRRRA